MSLRGQTRSAGTCEVCGSTCEVITGDDGTSHYEPVDVPRLLARIDDLEDQLSVYEAKGQPTVPWDEVKKKAGLA